MERAVLHRSDASESIALRVCNRRERERERDVLHWEERDERLIRWITDEEKQSERGGSRKRLQAAS